MEKGAVWRKAFDYLWNALIILLPITSFPLIVHLVGSDVVGLPSGVLLIIMVVVWYIPWLLKQGTIIRTSIPLLVFTGAALFSSALAIYRWIPVGNGSGIFREEITSVATLALGVGMYLVSSQWTKKPGRLQITLRLINYTGAVVIGWSLLQALAWYGLGEYPRVLGRTNRFFSTGMLYKGRVTGLALEPSWYAHQLNMLYLPFWFAATINQYSVHRSRLFHRISWENVLLFAGIAALVLTRSRVGYVAFLLMTVVYFWDVNQKIVNWIYQKYVNRMPTIQRDQSGLLRKYQRTRKRLRIVINIVMVLIYLTIFAGVAFLFYQFDERMETLFQFNVAQPQWLYQYLGKLNLGPRVTFWLAGWGVFEKYPLFGVGLGNSGFFFWETIPNLGWTFEEVRRLMWESASVLNPKNLWVRLLAETGLVGFTCFVSWLLTNASISVWLRKQSNSAFIRTMGTMGLMVVLGLLVEGFSVDSFSLVYFWLSFGLVTSAYIQSVHAKGKEE
ncbi:MAG: O-antigen ligase family protein [Anaerolineae bacterium]|jgi:O-antigen ligase|nr:O-antigen ligase family protein [Anaerolineae bacterium]